MRGTSFSFLYALLVLVIFSAGCEACKDAFDGGDGTDPLNRGVGGTCSDVSDCRTGLVCADDSTCQPSGTGPAGSICQLTGDCAEGLYCGPSRTCETAGELPEGADCAETGSCERGLVCVVEGFGGRCRPSGMGDLEHSCSLHTDCLAGLACEAGAMGSACQSPNAAVVPDGGTPPPTLPYWPGETCGEEEGTVALFDVPRGAAGDFYRLPFPNDIRRTDGGLDLMGHPSPGTVLPIDIIDRYLRASEEDLDGFATNPVVYFRFSTPYDADTLGDSFRLVDITPDSPDYGTDVPVAWMWTSGPVTKYICENWFAMRTLHGRPLRPGTTYAAVVSTSLLPASGGSFDRSADFEAMLADTTPSDTDLTQAWDRYEPLRTWVADTSTDAGTVLNAAVFTTQETEPIIPGLRAVIQALDTPAVTDLTACADGVTSPCDDGTEQRACSATDPDFVELHGRIALPIFQQGTAPYEEPEDGGGIELDGDGVPMVARTEPVCFALTVPRDLPPPAEGFPLLLVAHGTGGSFAGAVRSGLAAEVSDGDAGGTPVRSATLSIDLPQHGARRGESERSPDVLFFNFLNPRAARDNITQGSADLLTLVRWASSFAQEAASSPSGQDIRFDPARVVLFAHSQGATHASLMLPFEPGIGSVVLSGNGGDLTQSLLNKTQPVDIASVLPFALMDPNRDFSGLAAGAFHPALALFQAYFERVDPVNFGRRIYREPVDGVGGHHVFMTYGTGDTYSPEPTMRAYSIAASLFVVRPLVTEGWGLGEVEAPLASNVTVDATPWTVGLRQYEPPSGVDGHFVATRSEGGSADTSRFLLQALAGETPEIGE